MSNYPTRKSFKSVERDRPKHSEKLAGISGSGQPKKGGSGKGGWGKPGDELKSTGTMDKRDPNYVDSAEEYIDSLSPEYYLNSSSAVKLLHPQFIPPESNRLRFATSIADYSLFKDRVRAAAGEYLNSSDVIEFIQIVSELELPIYLQDLPYIILKYSFDQSPHNRTVLAHLITELIKKALITNNHLTNSLRKLYNQLNELSIDIPSASIYLKELLDYFRIQHCIDSTLVNELDSTVNTINDRETIIQLKEKLHNIYTEYLFEGDSADCITSLKELSIPECLKYESIRQLLSLAIDSKNSQREFASRLLVSMLSNHLVELSHIERAFALILERIEDLYLDCPDILRVASCFIARAVNDECLTPAFLARVDLSDRDLGVQVLKSAENALNQPDAAEHIQSVWDELEAEQHQSSADATENELAFKSDNGSHSVDPSEKQHHGI